jgi:3(or 17)beta-hydroxysteroid dehydrogenase
MTAAPNIGRVHGKVALVTGAASGIGLACARRLAAEGAHVALADLDGAGAKRAAEDIRRLGGTAMALSLDVTQEADWQAATRRVMDEWRRLDVTVNCAGSRIERCFPSETSLQDWQSLLRINLDGVFLGTKHSLKAMQASDPVRGSIINISSILGMVGLAGTDAYGASKGAVRSYSKSVAISCAEAGVHVRVNSVHPGFVDTPLLARAIDAAPDPQAARAAIETLAPVGRLGSPDDVAWGVLYLASDESDFVTGAELVIDGGYTAR